MGPATKRRGGGLGRVARLLVCLGACNCLFLGGCMWWMVSGRGGAAGGDGSGSSVTVSNLKARIRELESSAAAMMGRGGAAAPLKTTLGEIPCDGCDLAQSAELNRRFNFFVLNLDRRPDKMACVRKQFARYGINVRRMPGIDSLSMDIPHLTLLPPTVKAFLKNNPGQSGHVGCLYGHVRFFMGAASGNDGCGAEKKDLVSDESGNHDDKPISLTFQNRWSKPVELLWIRADGTEERVGDWVAPGDVRSVSTLLLHAWRVREQESKMQLSQFKLEHHQAPSSAYSMNAERTLAHVFVFGCPPQDESLLHGSGQAADNSKISIIFEDDVVLRDDFADKLLWSFDQMRHKQEPWDIFLLNWYCNSAHWKECDKNKGTSAVARRPFDARDRGLYSYTSGLGAYSLPRVKYFMSGGAYAVSSSGARKLLDTFPCDNHRYTCSMAVDWHMSTLISPGIVKVVGASPPFVLMPEMGSVQSLQIRTPPRSKMQVCGTYKSDTHYEGKNRAPILGRGGAQAVSAVVHQIELEKSNMEREARAKFSKNGLSAPGSRFTAFDKPLSWTSASAFCKSKGKRLATITNAQENQEATTLVRQACGHTRSHLGGWDLCAWMGLNDYKEEGALVWESHSNAGYRNFLEGEPNNMGDEDGMAVCWTFDGKWIDYSNSQSLPCLLCEDYADAHQQAALTIAQKKKTDQAQQKHARKANQEFWKASAFFAKHKLASKSRSKGAFARPIARL